VQGKAAKCIHPRRQCTSSSLAMRYYCIQVIYNPGTYLK
jgi:hypothetical protein